jgi:tetratricopeptide (TPR) repeat protein
MQPTRQAEMFAQARACFASGDVAGASALCDTLLRESPSHPQVRHLHGVLMLAVGRLKEARTSLNVALEKRPDDPLLLNDLGQVYVREERYEDARKLAERAIRAHPMHPIAQAMLGEIAFTTGDFEAGWRAVEPLEREDPPNLPVSIAYGKLCRRFGKLERGIDVLGRALGDERQPKAFRKTGLFVLGELLDAAGEYASAFEAITRGRELNRAEGRFDLGEFNRRVDLTRTAWTADVIRRASEHGDPSDLPVFVLGMWRSGTTLVEQIIATHPAAHGAGELFDLGTIAQRLEGRVELVPLLTRVEALTSSALASGAREYLGTLRKRSANTARVTDKMPMNLLHMGLIGAMLPGARVIRCERDPRDVCLSCYFNLPGDRAHYSDDLATLGRFYRVCEELMDFWASVVAKPALKVRYERVVHEAEEESRRLIDFIGLQWDPKCVRFHENKRVARTASLDQVRRPIYTSSIGRWRNYVNVIGPLLDVLGLISE